ncbi:MAG: 50S ribosomal protein L30 [Candidatus Lokiarchaeota archaeon]|nr:50S ribosomal protein L30 [Candidatus Lokiarchaeota archaeon]
MNSNSISTDRNQRLIVIRLRGRVGVKYDIADTLKMLNLNRVNHAVVIDNRKSYIGMLQKVKDYVTWGILDENICLHLFKKRARLVGNQPLNDEYVRTYTKYQNIDELAKAFLKFEVEIKNLPHLKRVFRLHPPRKGFKYTKKRPFGDFGELGNRKELVEELVKRML